MSDTKVQGQSMLRQLFGKTKSFFSTERTCSPLCDCFLLHYSLRRDRLSGRTLEFVESHIPQSDYPIFQVIEEPMPEGIPDEYIGVQSLWSEGKLIHRVGLKIQTEIVEKTTLVSTELS